MEYKNYRLYIRKILANPSQYGSGNIDTRYYDRDFSPTQVIFKARTAEEAMRKACKFWREGDFGMGSITVKEEAL